MPSVIIEVRKDYNKEEGTRIMDAVHSALQNAFKIKPSDKVVRLVKHSPDNFAGPTNLDKPELYTYISIDAYSGRSVDAKRNLYKNIVRNLESLDIPKDHVLILLRE